MYLPDFGSFFSLFCVPPEPCPTYKRTNPMNKHPASGPATPEDNAPGGEAAPGDMPNSDELQPHVIYLNDPASPRCATWQLQQGHEALALFTSSEAAANYQTNHLNQQWQVFRPDRSTLLTLLRASESQGVLYAVLDPDGESAKRIFDLPLVLKNAEQQTAE